MYEGGSGSGSRYSSPLVRRERWVLAGECTREGEGLLVLVSGRELQGRGSRYSSSDMSPGGGVYFI